MRNRPVYIPKRGPAKKFKNTGPGIARDWNLIEWVRAFKVRDIEVAPYKQYSSRIFDLVAFHNCQNF